MVTGPEWAAKPYKNEASVLFNAFRGYSLECVSDLFTRAEWVDLHVRNFTNQFPFTLLNLPANQIALVSVVKTFGADRGVN